MPGSSPIRTQPHFWVLSGWATIRALVRRQTLRRLSLLIQRVARCTDSRGPSERSIHDWAINSRVGSLDPLHMQVPTLELLIVVSM